MRAFILPLSKISVKNKCYYYKNSLWFFFKSVSSIKKWICTVNMTKKKKKKPHEDLVLCFGSVPLPHFSHRNGSAIFSQKQRTCGCTESQPEHELWGSQGQSLPNPWNRSPSWHSFSLQDCGGENRHTWKQRKIM